MSTLMPGVLLLEDIERLAHLQRLRIVEAECDRGIRGRDAASHEASESSNRNPTHAETRDHWTLPKVTFSPRPAPTGFAARGAWAPPPWIQAPA
jgi:hypothetical protein